MRSCSKILVENSAYITKTINIDRGDDNENDNFREEEDRKEETEDKKEGRRGRTGELIQKEEKKMKICIFVKSILPLEWFR